MKKAVLIFLVFLVAGLVYLFVKKPRFEVHITAEQIQSLLEKKFPYEKSSLFLVKTVLSNPQVHLEKGNDHVGIRCDISVSIARVKTLETRVYVETGIRYDSKSESVFLVQPELRDFQIRGVPGDTERVVREIVGQAVVEILALEPVYRFAGSDMKGKIARAILKDIEIRDGSLTVVFGL